MKNKITSNQTLNEDEKNKLYKVLINNKKVFSDKLGNCNSYVHAFHVTDITPFNHKCRIISLSLVSQIIKRDTKLRIARRDR